MLGARAAAENRPIHEVVYDFLLENDGDSFAILLGSNYMAGNHDVIHTMLSDPNTVTGLSDAGAHVNLIFDAVAPTYQLMHWVRDRSRGERLPLELIVQKQSQTNAELYGLGDRGSLTVVFQDLHGVAIRVQHESCRNRPVFEAFRLRH